MAKTQKANGAASPALNPVISNDNADILAGMRQTPAPIVPAKTEEQLILEGEIAKLKAENEALRKGGVSTSRSITLRVSEKGALSVYGLGRFPVTLYREQWERLVAIGDEIKQFIAENSDKLKVKGE